MTALGASCTSGSQGGTASTGSTRVAPTSILTSALTTLPDDPDALNVAVVADSEVPAEAVDLVDGRAGIAVSSRVTEPGWTVEELDPLSDAALASKPDVLVYSAGANDLPEKGISGMLPLVESRVDEAKAKAATCVVPAVDTASMEEPERSQTDQMLVAVQGRRLRLGRRCRVVPGDRQGDGGRRRAVLQGRRTGAFRTRARMPIPVSLMRSQSRSERADEQPTDPSVRLLAVTDHRLSSGRRGRRRRGDPGGWR